MNGKKKLTAVKCRLMPGMFSSECLFTVTLADASEHKGVASVDFFWDSNGTALPQAPQVNSQEGYIAARIVEEIDGEQFAVEVPDGEVLAVLKAQLLPRPTDVAPPGQSARAR